jgi:hypothetical protein
MEASKLCNPDMKMRWKFENNFETRQSKWCLQEAGML